MLTSLPKVSIIIPSLNESEFIVECVESLLLGNFPSKNMEILIVDGGSSDDTVIKAKTLRDTYSNVRYLHNPKKIVPAAMNLGVENASNELLMWCGSHAKYDSEYVLNSIIALSEEIDASSVGGVITPIAKTAIGKAIAIATSSKFGIGNAKYRYATKRQQVDTVFGGCFYKTSILEIGGFNERWVRNQDYELNHRLRSKIGPIILEPSIRCEYYCRESISQLSKQYFGYGFWRFNTLLAHPSSFTYRQAAPVSLCLSLLGSMIFLALGSPLGLVVPVIYSFLSLVISAYVAVIKKTFILLLYLPIIFATLHCSWGLGFITSALKNTYTGLLKRDST